MAFAGNASRIRKANFTLTYTGALASASCSFTLKNDGNFYLELFENNVLLFSLNVGTGEESSFTTVNTVITAITAALIPFTAASTQTSLPIAFMDKFEDVSIVTTPFNATLCYADLIPHAGANFPAANAPSYVEHEVVSCVQTRNVLYIAAYDTPLKKYEGIRIYNAGVPKPGSFTPSTSGAGVITNSDLKYLIVYENKDAKGNLTEGEYALQANTTALVASSNSVSISVPQIVTASGYNTSCAIVNGNQTGVTTITVNNPQGFLVGDTAFFLDGVTGLNTERLVTNQTTTSITIAGAPVNVTNAQVISNNLRIYIYRNIAGGSTYYLQSVIPNNSFVATVTITDNTADSALGEDYVIPVKQRGLPPKGSYITLFRGVLFSTGVATDINNVFYSDIESPENFPADENQFLVETVEGDKIRGIAPSLNTVYVFKSKSIHAITGDFVNDNFRLNLVGRSDVGLAAHASIKEVNSALYFMSNYGVFAINADAQDVVEIGKLINPIFLNQNNYNLRQCVAVNWKQKDRYILMVPVNETISSIVLTDKNDSLMLCYDYASPGWYPWSNLDGSNGMTIDQDGSIWFIEKAYDSSISSPRGYVQRMSQTGSSQDYADHNLAITSIIKDGWITLGEPSVFKKFLRIKVRAIESNSSPLESDSFTIRIQTQHDFLDVPVTDVLTQFSGGVGGWGEQPWNEFPWGMSRPISVIRKLYAGKAQALRIVFIHDTLLENFMISGYEIEIATPFAIKLGD